MYRDDFWFKKHPETISEYYHDEQETEVEETDPVAAYTAEDHGEAHEGHGGIHLPDMSYYPFILGLGVAIFGIGFLTNTYVIAAGVPIFIWGTLGWSMEPVNDPT